MGTYTFLEAVEKLSDGKCGKIAPKKEPGLYYCINEHGHLNCMGYHDSGIKLGVKHFLGRWVLVNEKEIKPADNKIFSGKNSEKLWSEINSLYGSPIKDILYSLGCKLQEVEDKIDEGVKT